MSIVNVTPLALAVTIATVGCTNDPRYVDDGVVLETNAPGTMDTGTVTTTIDVPFRLEEPDELMERQELAAELGVEVPYVKLEDVAISIEWSVENLSDEAGIFTITVNGATEFAAYVPALFVVDPDEDEEPPSLMGGVPLIIEPGETRSGVFREDEVFEASVDLELMYRAAYNAFAAVLEQNMTTPEIIDTAGATVPSSVYASMVRFDITLTADRNMQMRYTVRVRDDRGILHEKLLNPDDPGELTVFNPIEIQPPPPMP